MDEEDKNKIVKEEENKVDEAQSEGEKQPLGESKPINDLKPTIPEQESSETDKSEEEKLMEEVLSSREEKLRLLAEMENLRKRIEREKIESIKFGSINLAREILSLGDNLERALIAIPKNEDFSQSIKNFVEGFDATVSFPSRTARNRYITCIKF